MRHARLHAHTTGVKLQIIINLWGAMDQCAVATLNQVNREQKGKGINIYILIYINLDEQEKEYNEEERRGGEDITYFLLRLATCWL